MWCARKATDPSLEWFAVLSVNLDEMTCRIIRYKADAYRTVPLIDILTSRPFSIYPCNCAVSRNSTPRTQASKLSRIRTPMFHDTRFTILLTVDSLWPRCPIQSLEQCGAPLAWLRNAEKDEHGYEWGNVALLSLPKNTKCGCNRARFRSVLRTR